MVVTVAYGRTRIIMGGSRELVSMTIKNYFVTKYTHGEKKNKKYLYVFCIKIKIKKTNTLNNFFLNVRADKTGTIRFFKKKKKINNTFVVYLQIIIMKTTKNNNRRLKCVGIGDGRGYTTG